MPKARVGNVELYYETAGSGRRVMFISGTGGDLRVRPNPCEGPLASVFEVLAYDQRGLGRSSVPPGPYCMADYADDAAGLLGVAGWDRAAVVGVSFGGMVAQELALRHPGRVSSLVLACTSSGGEGGASYPLHDLASLDPEERLILMAELSDRRMDAKWRSDNPHKWQHALDWRRRYGEVGAGEPGRELGASLQLEARRHHDTWQRLGAIACPTLVCAGRYDGIAPVENSQRLAGAIPGARLEVFEGGHLFLMQDPAAYPAIIEFLSS